MNLEGWQAGLLLGAGVSLVLDHGIAWLRIRWQRKEHAHDCARAGLHCARCGGCIEADGKSLFRPERLVVCPDCGDAMLAGAVATDSDPAAFGRMIVVYPAPGALDALQAEIAELKASGFPDTPAE